MGQDKFDQGMKLRKQVLGAEYVERSMAGADEFSMPMQELSTEYCWGHVWSRPGLALRDRSLINIAMISALNRPHELKLHVKAALNNGVTREEIREVLLQVAVYCGVPAGIDRRAHCARSVCGDRRREEGVTHGQRAHSAGAAGTRFLPHPEHRRTRGHPGDLASRCHLGGRWWRACRAPALMGRATKSSMSFLAPVRGPVHAGRSEDHGRSHGVERRHRDVRIARQGDAARPAAPTTIAMPGASTCATARFLPFANTWTATTSRPCSAALREPSPPLPPAREPAPVLPPAMSLRCPCRRR